MFLVLLLPHPFSPQLGYVHSSVLVSSLLQYLDSLSFTYISQRGVILGKTFEMKSPGKKGRVRETWIVKAIGRGNLSRDR
jgi:hypothetical protein